VPRYDANVGIGALVSGYAIPIFALRYPMTLFGYTETRVPYLYVSAPLIALGYLIWQRRRGKSGLMARLRDR
jgi:hypothetical protein